MPSKRVKLAERSKLFIPAAFRRKRVIGPSDLSDWPEIDRLLQLTFDQDLQRSCIRPHSSLGGQTPVASVNEV